MSSTLLSQLISQLPLLLFYVVAIFMSLARMNRHSNVSLLTMLGMGVCLVNTLVFTGLFFWLSNASGRLGLPRSEAYLIMGMVRGVIHAGGLALVLAAVFTGRREQYKPGFGVEPRGPQIPLPPTAAIYRPGQR